MKIMHTSDLHIGRRLYELRLEDEQKKILDEITDKAVAENVDAVVISGDVFDRSAPSVESVRIYDDFMSDLWKKTGKPIFVSSGNHDSVDRLSQNSKILSCQGLYISPNFLSDGIRKVTLSDDRGNVNFFLFPYLSPALIRERYGLSDTMTWDDAFTYLLERMEEDGEINWRERNVALMHQYITGTERAESENDIGGIDAVSSSVVEKFDYVALGHLHRPQFAGSKRINYSGTPLSYSFSEDRDKKSVSIVTIKGKDEEPVVERLPLTVPYTLKRKEGNLEELLTEGRAMEKKDDVYWSFTLLDKTEQTGALSLLRGVYGTVLEVKIKALEERLQTLGEVKLREGERSLTPFEVTLNFFNELNPDSPLTEEGEKILRSLLEEAAENDKEALA